MILPIELADFSPKERQIVYGQESDAVPVVTLGPRSYLVSASLELGSPDCHVLIGRYSSLAHRLKFIIGLNHNGQSVSTYPFQEVLGPSKKDVANNQRKSNHYQVIIGNDVCIGADATILGGVRIGNGAIIGAGAVVAKDIPPYAVAAGNPARVVKYRFPQETIDKLQEIKWWNWPDETIQANLPVFENIDVFLKKFQPLPPSPTGKNLADRIRMLRNQGKTIYSFVADFKSKRPLWRRTLNAYLENFSSWDDCVLLFAAENQQQYQTYIGEVQRMLEGAGSQHPSVALLGGISSAIPEFMQGTDYFIATREDISSQCIDFAAGHNAGILSGLDDNIFSFPRLQHPTESPQREKDTLSEKKSKIDNWIQQEIQKIKDLIQAGNCDGAMEKIAVLGNMLYEYNQEYTNEDLEKCLQEIKAQLENNQPLESYSAKDSVVLFYDGFGLDTRGLALIYLDAIDRLGYHLLYVAPEHARGRIPTLEGILARNGADIEYIPSDRTSDACRKLCKIIREHMPSRGFLYTTPYDAVGLLAFMHFSGAMARYQVNLTDHAFWLGINAFDYCLEFRDYGASISSVYRGIPKSKLIRMSFYPYFDPDVPFEGFPFEKNPGDFIVFSGGFLYKTYDAEGTYYRVVENVLKQHPNVKFWYAGYGESSDLKRLIETYPGRAFHTRERKDLFAVMQHIDMYLNTYPSLGGLMTQYSAIAGRPPMTLTHGDGGDGFLRNQHGLGIEFSTAEEWEAAIHRFIEDPNYRKALEQNMRGTVCTREEFTANLGNAIRNPKPSSFHFTTPYVQEYRRETLERFVKTQNL